MSYVGVVRDDVVKGGDPRTYRSKVMIASGFVTIVSNDADGAPGRLGPSVGGKECTVVLVSRCVHRRLGTSTSMSSFYRNIATCVCGGICRGLKIRRQLGRRPRRQLATSTVLCDRAEGRM